MAGSWPRSGLPPRARPRPDTPRRWPGAGPPREIAGRRPPASRTAGSAETFPGPESVRTRACRTARGSSSCRPHRRRARSLLRSGVDPQDGAEDLQGVRLLALEGVAADDRAEAPAVPNGADLLAHLLIADRRPAREDNHAASVEGRLHDVADALGQRPHRHAFLLVHLLGRRLLQ